jgi:hypothetical protein
MPPWATVSQPVETSNWKAESILPAVIVYDRVYPASSYPITRTIDLPVRAFSGTGTGNIVATFGRIELTVLKFAIEEVAQKTGPSMPASHTEIERL